MMPANRPDTRTDLMSAHIWTREEKQSAAVDTSTVYNASWSMKTKAANGANLKYPNVSKKMETALENN